MSSPEQEHTLPLVVTEAGATAPDQQLFAVQALIVNFATIERNHYRAKTEQKETDAEHSLSVAYLCWYIHDAYDVDLDIATILKYAMLHDIVEVYAGDVSAFATQTDRQQKIIDETEAENRLALEHQGFGDFVDHMNSYQVEEDDDDEAWFVWTVDKMQALIMGDLDDWRPYIELGITYEAFCEKYDALLERCSPHCRDIFSEVIEYSKQRYQAKLSRI